MADKSIMKLNMLTLKFSGDLSYLEVPFQSENFRASLHKNRAALAVGVLFYSAFGILDALLMPENKSPIWWIRFAVVDPAAIGIFLASFSKCFERYVNPAMTFVSILAGGGIIFMIIIAPPPVNYFYYAGLMVVFIWTYAFIRISFLWASFSGWVLVILYEIVAIWISPTPFAILLNNSFFSISANIMGMIACYSLEYYTRRNFFLNRQIEMERENTNIANRALETRTAEYQTLNRTLKQEITYRAQAEEALRESEELYRTALENSNDGVAIVQDGRCVYSNEKFLDKLGRNRDEILGSSMDVFIHPEDRVVFRDYFLECQQGLSTSNHFETRAVLPDGAIRYADVSLAEVTYKGKKSVLLYARDITDRKQAEEERHRYEKLQGVLEMAGAVCHEMNQPLQIISGYSEMLLMNISENDPLHAKLDAINKQIQRMGSVTKKLMKIEDFDTQDYAGFSRIIKINKNSGNDAE